MLKRYVTHAVRVGAHEPWLSLEGRLSHIMFMLQHGKNIAWLHEELTDMVEALGEKS